MPDCSELSKTLTQIAMNIGSRDGINTINDVLLEMQKDFPILRRESLVDAIVEATQGKKQDSDDLLKKLYRIRQEARSDKLLKKRINELENYLKTGELPKVVRKENTSSEEIQVLKDIRDGLKKQINQSEPARAERLKKSIAELERRIKENDLQPIVKVKLPSTKELEQLEYEKRLLQRDIRNRIRELKPKSIWEHIAEPFNLARAMIASVDFSAVLRQGGFIAFARPMRALKTLPAMFKAAASEKTALQIYDEIMSRPNAPMYDRAKLYIAPIDGSEKLSKREEAYMTSWISKLPKGIKFPFEASERAYVTFLNKLRADSFDTMAYGLSEDGNVTQEEAEAIANFINVATGRGNLGMIERAAVPLNTLFFAPKHAVSRFQLLLGQPLWKGTIETKKMIAKEYARYLIGVGTLFALGTLAGGDDEWDPRSANFGKLKFGNTRIDLLSGMAQVTTLLSRIILGGRKNNSGVVVPIRGEKVPYGGANTYDVITQFLRYKFSPMIGTSVNVVTGKNPIGEPVTVGSTIRDLTVPLSLRDIYETIQEQGVPVGAAMGLMSIFGLGLQTYGNTFEDKALKQILEENGTSADYINTMRDYYNKMKISFEGKEVKFKKKYNIYKTLGASNKYVDDLMKSRTNEEKSEYLMKIYNEIPYKNFIRFYFDAKETKLISDPLNKLFKSKLGNKGFQGDLIKYEIKQLQIKKATKKITKEEKLRLELLNKYYTGEIR